MCFKGIGAKFACRWCAMPAVRVGPPGEEYGKYYLTTKSSDGPDNVDYSDLPLRDHRSVRKDIQDIRECRTKGEKDAMQTQKGINDQVRSEGHTYHRSYTDTTRLVRFLVDWVDRFPLVI